MKKKLLRIIVLFLAFTAIKPDLVSAQSSPYCPCYMHNTGTVISLRGQEFYNSFPAGDYMITLISDEMDAMGCPPLLNVPVTVTKTTEVLNCDPGSVSGPGVCISFASVPGCSSGLPNLRSGSSGFTLTPVGQLEPILIITFSGGTLENCEYTPLYLSWSNFTTEVSPPNYYAKIKWTTNSGDQILHYSLQKSLDGANFVKIAEIPASGNHNYEITDMNPHATSYYRVIAVDIDCNWTISPVVMASCNAGCNTSWPPAPVAPDCIAAYPLEGPSYICDNNYHIYKLNKVNGDVPIYWSAFPKSPVTIIKVGRLAAIKRNNGYNGVASLAVSYTKNGINYPFNKEITLGIPPINVNTNNTDLGNGTYRHTATIVPFIATSGANYQWYLNGSYVGTGLSKYWELPNVTFYSYEIRYSGPCGQSTYNGSTMVPIEPMFLVSPNPATSDLTVARKAVVGTLSAAQTEERIATDKSELDINIYDMLGNYKGTSKLRSGESNVKINIRSLPKGWYYLHVMKAGVRISTMKVMIDK